MPMRNRCLTTSFTHPKTGIRLRYLHGCPSFVLSCLTKRAAILRRGLAEIRVRDAWKSNLRPVQQTWH